MTKILLPWPDKKLSPNARLHWATVAKAKKIYRELCFWQARAQGVTETYLETPIAVHLTFYPPDKRGRDWDNMLASVKSGLDGVADALGVDDKHWRLSFEVAPTVGGMIRVAIGKVQS